MDKDDLCQKLRLRLMIPLVATVVASGAYCDSTADGYVQLREQHGAAKIDLSRVKEGPEYYHGIAIELRGTLSGVAKHGDSISFIVNTPDGCYIVDADQMPEMSSGSKICALVLVGEKCTATLSDLKLIAMAYQGQVAESERMALQAQAEKKAKLVVVEQSETPSDRGRFKRGDQLSSRSGNYSSVPGLVGVYKKAVKSFNSKLSDAEAEAIASSIIEFSARYEVDPRLVVAVILTESRFRPEATSRKGAMGLGQLMPRTAKGLGVGDAYDPVENIGGSVKLIKGHLDKLSGNAPWSELSWQDLALALASYNAGPGAVKKHGGIPPYRETQNYIKKVISTYRALCGEQ